MDTRLLLDIALILLTTKIFGLLTRRIHLPQVVGALAAGVVLGSALLGAVKINETIEIFADLGILLIMFEAGLLTDLKKLQKSIKSMLIIAVCGMALPFVCGFGLSFVFENGLKEQETVIRESIILGVIIMSSSVGIAVEAMHEMGKLNTKAGGLILGTAVVDDILGIIIFSFVVSMGGDSLSLPEIGLSLLVKVAFFALVVICGFLAFKLFEFLCVHRGMRRRLSVFGLAFCVLMAYAAERFGMSRILGAFFAGLVLCNSRAEKYIEEKSDVLSFVFFSPMFFASVGLKMSFNGLGKNEMLFMALFIVATILSKFVGCGLGAKLCKCTTREAVQVGSGMVARCEFPIVVAVLGKGLGLVDDKRFSIIIVMVITTALVTPILLKLAFRGKSGDSGDSENTEKSGETDKSVNIEKLKEKLV